MSNTNSVKKVTIIIPTFNYGHSIETAVESVLRDISHPAEKEIIVVDDGSTDNTHSVLFPFIANGSIHYFFQQNKGKASATRMAIEKATGDIIFNLDADDYFLPGKFDFFISLYEQYPSLVHIGSAAKIYNSSGEEGIETIPGFLQNRVVPGDDAIRFFLEKNCLFGGGSTFSARASALKKVNIPDEIDMYIDEYLILAILALGDSYISSTPYSVWYMHGANYSELAGSAAKRTRLLKSSVASLEYFKEKQSNAYFYQLYRLRHLNREIYFKELNKQKTISDVLIFFQQVFIRNRYGFEVLRQYKIWNRLIPQPLINLLK